MLPELLRSSSAARRRCISGFRNTGAQCSTSNPKPLFPSIAPRRKRPRDSQRVAVRNHSEAINFPERQCPPGILRVQTQAVVHLGRFCSNTVVSNLYRKDPLHYEIGNPQFTILSKLLPMLHVAEAHTAAIDGIKFIGLLTACSNIPRLPL